MNLAIIIIGTIAAIVGISVATWSIIDSKKRYNEESMRRKRGTKD